MGYSFIIPVYNCRDTLTACVRSIWAAALPDCEILLIDDGSTDGSAVLCDRLAEDFPEVRVFHQPNAGVSAARNRGLAEAKKDYILFADGDDTLDSKPLREVLQHSGDLLIFGVVMEYWHRGVCYRQDILGHPQAGRLDWQRDFLELFGNNTLGPVWNKVYRREIVEKHHLRFREDLSAYEDLEFVLRYIKHCETVVSVPKAVYRYRVSPKAAERIRRMGNISTFLQPLEGALEDLPLPRRTVDALRLQLFEILAWEKCGMTNGVKLCEDFRNWYETLEEKPEQPSKFVKQMLQGRGLGLKLCRKLILLRHALAVEVKTWIRKRF